MYIKNIIINYLNLWTFHTLGKYPYGYYEIIINFSK